MENKQEAISQGAKVESSKYKIHRVVTKGSKGGKIPRAPNYYGGAESLRGRQKSQQCRKYLLQYSTFCFRKTSDSNVGAPNLFHAPGDHLISLHP